MRTRDLTQEQIAALSEIQALMTRYGINAQELQHLSKAEMNTLILQIRGLMATWQIEPWELTGLGRREIQISNGASGHKPRSLPAKYRHPVSGEEWTGQGRQPQWLKDALTVEGMTVEQLRV
jgi:DNA-binding protein H-NS